MAVQSCRMYKLHIFLQFEPVFSTSVGSYSSETGAIFGLQLEAVCCKVIFEKHLRQIPKAHCDAKGYCFMHDKHHYFLNDTIGDIGNINAPPSGIKA